MRKTALLILFLLLSKSVWATNYCEYINCVTCYLFTEGSGIKAVDSSASVVDGDFKGDGEPAWDSISGTNAPSYASYEVNFDASDDYINTNQQDDWADSSGESFSYVGWIYPETLGEGDYGRIFAGWADSSNYLSFNLIATATLRFRWKGSTTLLVVADDNSISLNSTWHHVAITGDGSITAANYDIYVDGSEVAYKTQTNGASLGTIYNNYFLIGSEQTSGGYVFDGPMAQMAYFTGTELTSTDIDAIITYGLQPAEGGPPTYSGTGVIFMGDPILQDVIIR